MEDAFFSQLDGAAVRELLLRTGLRDAALFAVSDTLYIESCNRMAQQLSELHPMEPLDPFLSENLRDAVRRCIRTRTACSTEEEVDGTRYTVELIPHRKGALVAYLSRDRAAYDGSLRIIHNKSTVCLGALLADAERISDPAVAERMRRQCMRLYRLLSHSDFLHDPLLTEQLALRRCDLSALCRDAVAKAEVYVHADHARMTVNAPDRCEALVDARLIRIALYNLLTNALRVTPAEGEIVLSLRDGRDFLTITVADTGPGLDPQRFEALLSGWRHTTSFEDYRDLSCAGTPMGLGLPLVNQIAQQHGGCLLLSPRQEGGSELHFSIARLPDALEENRFHAPGIVEDGYTPEEIEFSVLGW